MLLINAVLYMKRIIKILPSINTYLCKALFKMLPFVIICLKDVINMLPSTDINNNKVTSQANLRDFLADTFFKAQFMTMFGCDSEGQKFTARSAYENLEVFHRYFNYLWLGVPLWLFPVGYRSLQALTEQPTSEEFLARPDISEWLRAEIQVGPVEN